MTRVRLLRWFLRLSAAVQVGYWGLSHLFFPGWYLRSIGLEELAANPGPALLFLHEIGVLTLGLGLATWLASIDPVREFSIVIVLYAVGLGSVTVSLWHVLGRGTAAGEWTTIVVILVQLGIVSALYPWRELRQRRAVPRQIAAPRE